MQQMCDQFKEWNSQIDIKDMSKMSKIKFIDVDGDDMEVDELNE